MSKIIRQPITVMPDGAGRPQCFTWRRRQYKVEALVEDWLEAGSWWDGEGEKAFYRLQCGEGLYEIYHDLAEKAWYLYRVLD
ncbi:MAG TPA: hypothetical protein GXX29_11550 [Firmicutes bacterium]|nr:hypothetical protein [Bacillota bacterium]